MHSTVLRGTDFDITVGGRPEAHGDYFRAFDRKGRLGVVAPRRIDGAGAINLIMAYVTAFYDDYRRDGDAFFAYPDFFVFQQMAPLANYCMFDIWPEYKLIYVGPPGATGPAGTGEAPGPADATAMLSALTNHGVQILLVPDVASPEHAFHKVALASARRCIERCYAYDFTGQAAGADVVIASRQSALLREWAGNMFDSVSSDDAVEGRARAWLAASRGERLEQSFRRIDLDDALARI